MIWVTIGLAAGTLFGMALVMSYVLGWANKAFHVEIDPRIEAMIETLPGANCGGCGYVGCNEYAAAVVRSEAPVNKCTVGGTSCAEALAGIMGIELEESYPYRPIVHCGAHYADRLKHSEYQGEPKCSAANLVADVQACTYGCLGMGDCERACNYDAMHVIDGLATVDYDKCVGCAACAAVCPRHLITMVPFKQEQMLAVTCSNKDVGAEVKAVCKVGCIGCKACSRFCSLLEMDANLPTINYDLYCMDYMEELQKAVEKCPGGGLVFIGKPSAKDKAAVEDEAVPEVVEPDFKTTVDDTEWRG